MTPADQLTDAPTEMEERVAAALEEATLGYSINLVRLVDGESTYRASVDRQPPREFDGYDEASEYVQGFIRLAKARAAISAMPAAAQNTAWELRMFNALRASRSLIKQLIQAQYNVATYELYQRLEAIDAALTQSGAA